MRIHCNGISVVSLICLMGPLSRAQIAAPSLGSKPAGSSSSSASSTTGSSALAVVPQDFSKMKIAPGFMLAVSVYDAGELSGSFRVQDDGRITMPLVGSLPVTGQTTVEAQRTIEAAYLNHQMLTHPQVTVNVVEYTPLLISMMGEVAKPGHLQLQAPDNLADVLSLAGGLTDLAGREVQVKHQTGTTDTYTFSKDGNTSSIKGVMVADGDTVNVPRAGVVYVLGAVFKPGGYVMQEFGTLTVAQALSLAQGTSRDAKVGNIRVVRTKSDGSLEEFAVNYPAIMAGKQHALVLQAKDIVYVPVSKLKTVFLSSSGLVNVAASTSVAVGK